MRDDERDCNPILLPYLQAAGEVESARALERLIEHATPIIYGVVKRKLDGRPREDVEDVCGLVRIRVVSRLQQLKSGGSAEPISSFVGYVKGTASNACADYYRRPSGPPTAAIQEDEENPVYEAPARTNLQREAEIRGKLEQLWSELIQLPIGQRRTILLNLAEIDLFPILGVASIRTIARALEMPAEDLAALWNQLPLEDNDIALRERITRQQVINLRKAGRDRLARRLRGW